jgi:hypothetical protein
MVDSYIHLQEEDDSCFVSELYQTWGGSWTEEKLEAFEKYVNAYLTIMNKYRDQFGWKLLYFDGFAGSGTRTTNQGADSELMMELFREQEISLEQISVYQSAAERVVNIKQRGFDYYYFVDLDKSANDELKEKLHPYSNQGKNLTFRNTDANSITKRMGEHLIGNEKIKGLVLLDPFGMNLDWETIAALKGASVDLWILVPSGVIINRLLERDGSLKHIEKLKQYFGLTKSEIESRFYTKKTDKTLFGEIEKMEKVKEPIKRIAELYVERLKTLFPYVTENPLVMTNTKGVPIFHFVFASNNKNAMKIAQQIISKKAK